MTRAAILAAIGVALPRAASAYPQFIAKGYTNCATCHYSPNGGGMPNSYGHATLVAMLPDELDLEALQTFRGWVSKNDVTGHDDETDEASLQWDVGLDARLLLLLAAQQVNDARTLLAVPMLLELDGVLAFGPCTLYASLALAKDTSGPRQLTLQSREHWLQWRMNPSLSARVGRLALPFGLRLPDHTAVTREDLGFRQFDQSYAVELDWITEEWVIAAAGFFGDFLNQPPGLQERGGVATAIHNVPAWAAFGLSALYGNSDFFHRVALSVHVRARFGAGFYGLAEVAGERRFAAVSNRAESIAVGLLRLGWFPLESLDLYAEVSARIGERSALTKLRYVVAVGWQLLPWVELAPALQVEELRGVATELQLLGQIHVIY